MIYGPGSVAIVPRPVRIDTNPPYYDWRETGYRADEFSGSADLAATVRADIAEAKRDGRLPAKMRTLVSARSSYGATSLTLTVRGLTREDLFDEPPTTGSMFTIAGVREGDHVHTEWVMNPEWAFALLQLFCIGEAYNSKSSGRGDDYVQTRYSTDLQVQQIASFNLWHLASIVDGTSLQEE